MAFYSSNQVKSQYIDPKSFIDGQRAVFELPGHHLAYLPNLTLIDIGIFGQATATARYNDLIGANALIEEIQLYDGKTLLSEVRHYGLYRGFLLQNVKNSPAMALSAMKNLNKLGYEQDNTAGTGTTPKLSFILGNLGLNPDTTRDAAHGAQIDLREVLPLLNNISHLPADMFKNLRLEVKFNSAVAKQVMNNDTHTITGMKVPLLVADVIDDPMVVKKLNAGMGKGVQWLEIEHDEIRFSQNADNGASAASQGAVQELSAKLDGFRNKSVERLLEIKELNNPAAYITANVVQGFGRYSSIGMFNERTQYRLNGRNILPDQGLQGTAEQLSYVVDTFGDCFAYPGSNGIDVDPSTVIVGSLGTEASGTAQRAQLSYNAVYLGENVKDLQIEKARTGLQDNRAVKGSTDVLRLHYFAEVKKAIIPQKNGSYLVSYL